MPKKIYALVNHGYAFSYVSVEPLIGAPIVISYGASLPLSRILSMIEGMNLGAINIYSGSQFIATTEY